MTDFELGPEKIIKDIQDCVSEIRAEVTEKGRPVTDDCNALLRLCVRLEYLLQFARKDKGKLGAPIDYWKFFCHCLADVKGIRDGLKFIKSHQDIKTPAGRARAFVRYCLVHKCLGDALQHCFSNEKMVKKFFLPRSILVQPQHWSQILEALYHLNELEMELDPLGPELDISWPSFSKRPPDSRVSWMPSRSLSSSMTSLVSRADSLISTQDDLRFEADPLSLFQHEAEKKEQEYLEIIKSLEQEVSAMREKYQLDTSILEKDCQELQKQIKDLEEQARPPATCQVAIQTDPAPSRINHLLIENNEKIAQLEAQVAALTKERDQLSNDKVMLSLKVENLFKDLETSKSSLEAYKEKTEYSLGKFQAKTDSTKEILTALECENRRMKLFKADALEEISSLKSKLEESENKNSLPVPHKNGIIPSMEEGEEDYLKSLASSTGLAHLVHQQSLLLGKLQNKLAKSFDENSKLKCQTDLLADMLRISSNSTFANGGESISGLKKIPQTPSLQEGASLEDRFTHNNVFLERMLESLQLLLAELTASCQLHRQVVDKVREQEKHLFGVTQELEATQSLVHTLKNEHSKLQSTGFILKDELKEKRKLLTRLKKQLEATREGSHRLHTMNTENQTEWQSLRDELDRRRSPKEEVASSSPQSTSTEEEKPVLKTKNDRLEYLEEQCKLLYLSLVQSSQRSSQLDQRLARIAQMGGSSLSSSEDATSSPPEPLVPNDIPQPDEVEDVLQEATDAEPSPSISPDAAAVQETEEEDVEEEEEEEEELSVVELRRKATRQFVDKIKQERKQSTVKEAELRAQVEELTQANEELGQRVALLTDQKNSIIKREAEYRKRMEFYFKKERESASLIQAKFRIEQEKLERLVGEMREEIEDKARQLEELQTFATDAQQAASKSQESIDNLTEQLNTEAETTLALDQEREHAALLTQDIRQRQIAMMEMDQELNQLRSDSLQLKRKVVQLIKEKDLLWQRTDRLSYLQRVQASDRWMDDQQVQACTECHTGFTFLLRKHHCRLCGRIFCYKCADNWVFMSSSRYRSRVCNECFTTQAEIREDMEKAASSSLLMNISEASEEVGTALEGDLPATASQPSAIFAMLTPARMSTTPPSAEQCPSPEHGARQGEEEFSVISDEEIVKSLSSSSPYNNPPDSESMEEAAVSNNLATVTCEDLWAGPVQGQVWVAPHSTCSLPVLCRELSETGTTYLGWEITAEPKGITVRVTCDSEVVVPDHHFVSDEHTLEGRLPLSKPGIYTLIFSNTLSMVMVRNVKYKLTLEEDSVKPSNSAHE